MRLEVICASLLLCSSWIMAADSPRIVYSKYFKGSVPEFVKIVVDKSGTVTYQESVNDELPVKFEITPETVNTVFNLADKLNHFSRPLEAQLKVANMGMKTFRYEDGSAATETKFNFTNDLDARQLADWFDSVIESEGDYIMLERTVKFDKLGVNQALLQVQMTMERNRLVAPRQFLPLLDRISKSETFMHMSRERAATLADAFRNPPAPKNEKKSDQ